MTILMEIPIWCFFFLLIFLIPNILSIMHYDSNSLCSCTTFEACRFLVFYTRSTPLKNQTERTIYQNTC
jgi:hypothetical protein